MIKKIYSRQDPTKLLHITCDTAQMSGSRCDIVEEEQFLQLAILKHNEGCTFAAHKHIFKEVPSQAIAQESWYVVRGSVQAILYDIDDTELVNETLKEGMLSITLHGGHNYKILEDDTLVLEYKTGPYYGQKLDKVFIHDQD